AMINKSSTACCLYPSLSIIAPSPEAKQRASSLHSNRAWKGLDALFASRKFEQLRTALRHFRKSAEITDKFVLSGAQLGPQRGCWARRGRGLTGHYGHIMNRASYWIG